MTRTTRKIDPPVMKIGGEKIKRGERKTVFLELAALYDFTQLKIPVEVIRSKHQGPVIFISAAIHGDEINGTEIIRRLSKRKYVNFKGTILLVPIVNVFGFNNKSRYLPDRRDLNRSFPGNSKGSLAARLANLFMKEIVNKCSHGIDLHTGAIHRSNLAQIRANLDDPETKEIAQSFGAPVNINSQLRDGSLRESARARNIKMLLFEGGEALRFDESVIKLGFKGCLSVMRKIGVLSYTKAPVKLKRSPYTANSSHWLRAPRSGLVIGLKKIGEEVNKGDVIATITDPLGLEEESIIAKDAGIIIGASVLPLANQGDALVHIGLFTDAKRVSGAISRLELLDS